MGTDSNMVYLLLEPSEQMQPDFNSRVSLIYSAYKWNFPVFKYEQNFKIVDH